MATTQITDVIVPEIVAPEMALRITEKSALFGSGAVIQDTKLANFAAGNFGQQIDVGMYNHINDADPNASTDDPTDVATALKNTMANVYAWKVMYNQAWSHANIVEALSKPDPNAVVTEQSSDYWAQWVDKYGISSLVGIFNDNVANDSGDMVESIYSDIAAPTAANKISYDAIVDASITLGDNIDDLTTIIMHSAVYGQALKNNDIDFIPDSDNTGTIAAYMGKRVIKSDLMPVIAGTNSPKYITALVGNGAFRYGEGAPAMPVEPDYNASGGNGEGIYTLWTRKHFVMAPTNYSLDVANLSFADESPTRAELETATTWTRTVPRKDVKIAFLATNG